MALDLVKFRRLSAISQSVLISFNKPGAAVTICVS